MNGWTMELLEDSSIKDALALIDANLTASAKTELESLAHTVIEGPRSALTERGTPFVVVMGSCVKREGALVTGETIIATGNPMILTQESVNIAAKIARDAWIEGAQNYWREVCRKAGSGAHIFLVWRKHPEFVLWSDWSLRVCIAMRGRFAVETLEDGQPWPYPTTGHPQTAAADFFAINKAFS